MEIGPTAPDRDRPALPMKSSVPSSVGLEFANRASATRAGRFAASGRITLSDGGPS
jgi:hypothetical protein